jgi:hypothetical protein
MDLSKLWMTLSKLWRPLASEVPAEALSSVIKNITTPEQFKAYQEGKEIDIRLRTPAIADPANWRAAAILLTGAVFFGFFVTAVWPLLQVEHRLNNEITAQHTQIESLKTEKIALEKDKSIKEQADALTSLKVQQQALTDNLQKLDDAVMSKNDELQKAHDAQIKLESEYAETKTKMDELNKRYAETDLLIVKIDEFTRGIGTNAPSQEQLTSLQKELERQKQLRSSSGFELLKNQLERRRLTGTMWEVTVPSFVFALTRFMSIPQSFNGAPNNAQLYFGSDGLAILRVTFRTNDGQTPFLTGSTLISWELHDKEIIMKTFEGETVIHVERDIPDGYFRAFKSGEQYGPVLLRAQSLNTFAEFRRLTNP